MAIGTHVSADIHSNFIVFNQNRSLDRYSDVCYGEKTTSFHLSFACWASWVAVRSSYYNAPFVSAQKMVSRQKAQENGRGMGQAEASVDEACSIH